MKQCEHYLENGERCSNRAVPGTYFCKTHGKIFFKPVKEETPAEPSSPKPKQAPAERPAVPEPAATETGPRAAPGPGGEEPVFPGLRTDERNILVAPQGVVFMDTDKTPKPDGLFNRLVRLISFLSRVMSLSGRLRIMTSKNAPEKALVFITPEDDADAGMSSVYDAASAAARLTGGRLYIGEDNAFVQYRDDRAPRGYDVPDFTPSEEKSLLLVGRQGNRAIPLTDYSETPLTDFCLKITPEPDVVRPAPERVYALTPAPFYPLFCRYFRKHHLCFGLARMGASDNDPILFEICPRPDAPTGQHVPRFTLNYLAGMPRTTLLTPVHENGGRRILVQWEHRYPIRISAIAEAFDPDDTVLLMADSYPNLRIHPSPKFFDGNRLVRVTAPRPSPLNLASKPVSDAAKLRLPVLLRPDNGPTPPISALILSNQELSWVKTLLYRMPEAAFKNFSLCMGEENSVLIGNHQPIEGIPFGRPLRRLNDAELFIPLRNRFVPDLPWEILRQALEIRDQVFTFFTDAYRLDISASDFVPLSRLLVADPNMPRVALNIRPVNTLPELKWTAPPEPAQKNESRGKTGDPSSKLKKDFPENSPGTGRKDSRETLTPESDGLQLPLREQAELFKKDNDFLAAAVCYSMLKDTANSARCYHKAINSAGTEPLPPLTQEQDKTKDISA